MPRVMGRMNIMMGLLSALLLQLAPSAGHANSAPPLVVFVNGYEDCCAWGMSDVIEAMRSRGAALMGVPWDSFTPDAKQRSRTSNDEPFRQQGADFINNRLNPNSPLILIGHSYGGDSVLSLLPLIRRRILFVGVIDPVAGGGSRARVVLQRSVPPNVHYFFNRWQENRLAIRNIVPFDSATSGLIGNCRAQYCDQDSQNIARNADGAPFQELCGWEEITCPGFRPFVSRGHKQRRILHNSMPYDAYIQRQIIDKVFALLGWR